MSFVIPTNFRQLPPVWEVAQPFHIDALGEVAYDTDPVIWARNHILAVLLTNPGERVMRPTYGAGIFNYVWENEDPLIQQEIISAVNTAVATWEPNVTINQIQFIPQPDFSGVVILEIAYSVGVAPTVYTMTITLGGTGIEVPSQPQLSS
jgi:uncharacterized protein